MAADFNVVRVADAPAARRFARDHLLAADLHATSTRARQLALDELKLIDSAPPARASEAILFGVAVQAAADCRHWAKQAVGLLSSYRASLDGVASIGQRSRSGCTAPDVLRVGQTVDRYAD